MRFAVFFVSLSLIALATAKGILGGYLPDYRAKSLDYDAVFAKLDAVTLFSFQPLPDGHLLNVDERFPPNVLQKIKSKASEHGVALWACVGGAGRSDELERALSDSHKRVTFVEDLVDFLIAHGFVGVDVNLTPSSKEDRVHLKAFLSELKSDFLSKSRSELGLALTSRLMNDVSTIELAKLVSEENVQYVNVMAYDLSRDGRSQGPHADMNQTASVTLYLVRQGVDPHRIVLGIPFYGRNLDTWVDQTYESIVVETLRALHDASEKERFVPTFPASQSEFKGVWYNNIGLVRQKAVFAVQELGAAGVFVWELGMDCRETKVIDVVGDAHLRSCFGGDESLLSALREEIDSIADSMGEL